MVGAFDEVTTRVWKSKPAAPQFTLNVTTDDGIMYHRLLIGIWAAVLITGWALSSRRPPRP